MFVCGGPINPRKVFWDYFTLKMKACGCFFASRLGVISQKPWELLSTAGRNTSIAFYRLKGPHCPKFKKKTLFVLSLPEFFIVLMRGRGWCLCKRASLVQRCQQPIRCDNLSPEICMADLKGLTFRRRIKSHVPFAGIIRRLPYSTRFQDKG